MTDNTTRMTYNSFLRITMLSNEDDTTITVSCQNVMYCDFEKSEKFTKDILF